MVSSLRGISTPTFYRRRLDCEAFACALKKGRAEGIKEVANALFEKALGGDTAAAIFFLKTRAGWSEKLEGKTISSNLEQLYTAAVLGQKHQQSASS